MTMTYTEFLYVLRGIRDAGWTVTGSIRDGEGRCPVCAACVALTGERHDNFYFDLAAARIGLPDVLTNEIANAADDTGATDAIRDAMLEALGLTETQAWL